MFKEKIANFYMSNMVLKVSIVAAMLSWLVMILVGDTTINSIYSLIYVLLLAGLYVAMRKDVINVQKMLLGSLLMYLITSHLVTFTENMQHGTNYLTIISAFNLILCVIVFVCHILQQLDHFGENIGSMTGQFCGIIILLYFVNIVLDLCSHSVTIGKAAYLIAIICTFIYLICIETKIQTYKKIRGENLKTGTWTEEKRQEAKNMFRI